VLSLLVQAAAAPSSFFDYGFGRFITSPGFGGLAALLAAGLAFLGVHRKQQHDTEVSRQDRWWSTVTWTYDRATAPDSDSRLTPGVALDLFQRLAEEAHSNLEKQAVRGLLGFFSDDRSKQETSREVGP